MIDRDVAVADASSASAGLILGLMLGVLAVLAVFYFTGAFSRLAGDRDTEIDVNIQQPSSPRAPGAARLAR